MLITYAVVAVLALILIAIIVAWKRSRRAPQAGSGQPAAQAAEPARGAAIDTGAEITEIAARNNTSDLDATLVYRRASQASAPAAPRNREAPLVAGARLVGLSGRQRGSSFPVVATGMTIGRSPSCDVVLDDARVSQRHAWVGIVDNKAVLRDLQSTNGTFVNTGTKSVASQTELCSGDTIFFGGHQGDQFRFLAD